MSKLKYLLFFLSFYSVYSQTSFNYINGFPAIFDSINNITYSFDTAAPTFVSTEKKIGDKTLGFMLIKDINNKKQFRGKQKLDLNLFGFGPLKTKALTIGKMKDCLDIDVFLGIDALDEKILFFNFEKQEFKVLEDLSLFDDKDYIEIPLTFDSFNYRYKIKASLAGEKINFLLDLGFSAEILIKNKIVNYNNSIDYVDISYFGANGSNVRTFEFLKDIDLIFSNNNLLTNDIRYSSSANHNLIGIGFFKKFQKVIFDFRKSKIYISKNKIDFKIKDEEIYFDVNESKIMISTINHNSLLYKNGYRVGDFVYLNDKILERDILNSPCDVNKLIKIWNSENPTKSLF